ncbi:hypothetical protein [Parasphingorhabdus sp.]|uniref:hypothetical protein n=1 Tax=Parasphingorhabdus sp. TaxID=2709688 RepID=UPI003266BED2
MMGHEYGEFQEGAGTLAKERISNLMDSAPYWDLTDEEKNDAIKDIIRKSRKEAKGAMGGGLFAIPPDAVLNDPDDLPPIPAGARLN